MRKFKLRLIQLSGLAALAVIGVVCLSWSATAFDFPGFARKPKLAPVRPPLLRDNEGLLVKSLLQITQGQNQAALETLDDLTRIAPNFKLAQLVRGDLLMAHARELNGFGGASAGSKEAISDFREEARVRLDHYLTQQNTPAVPDYLWQLDASQQNAIVVDTSRSRLYLYRNENGKPHYVADYYVTVGKNGTEKTKEGDKRTPLGIYFAGRQMEQRQLPDMYGIAAFPLSYPNEWDRHQGKDGHGIWLHGTPSNTYSRPPHASDGCVVMTNPDLSALTPILQNGKTPVVIAHDLVPSGEQAVAQKEELVQAMEQWRRDWEAQDSDHYLAFYSRSFFSPERNYDGWAQEKRRIQSAGIKASITLSNISMFRYPDDKQQMVVVTFAQRFKNGILNNEMRKRQYWVLESGRWKILYEGAV